MEEDIRCVQVMAPGGNAAVLEHVIDTHGHLQATCHVFGHAWAVLRPDGYLAASGESIDTSLVRALTMALGKAPEFPMKAA